MPSGGDLKIVENAGLAVTVCRLKRKPAHFFGPLERFLVAARWVGIGNTGAGR